MKKLLIVALSIFALAGCATQAEMEHTEKMYDKQIAATKQAVPTPVCQITAAPGQTITMSGVDKFSCYGPNDSTNKVPTFAEKPTTAQVVIGAVVEVAKGAVPIILNSQNQTTQRLASDNNVKVEGLRWGTVSNIATQGINAAAKDPLVVEPTVVFAPAP